MKNAKGIKVRKGYTIQYNNSFLGPLLGTVKHIARATVGRMPYTRVTLTNGNTCDINDVTHSRAPD